MAKTENRNQFIDVMRGIAILLVVLWHTMTGCTANSEKTFLSNVIWSLQMPLFILISGYVIRYSRKVENANGLLNYIGRRTLAYMLPWVTWSFIVRGVIFGQKSFFSIKVLLWHMDLGYWFLATIWTISIIFGVSVFFAGKIFKKSIIAQQLITAVSYVFGMLLLLGIGKILGLSFFAIKLTLYYMPFYFAGYLYGQYRDKIFNLKHGKVIVEAVIAICCAVWLFALMKCNVYELNDSGKDVILRALISGVGCITICGLCKKMFELSEKPNAVVKFFIWCGSHSLEIYVVHCLLLIPLRIAEIPDAGSVQAVCIAAANYLITVVLVLTVVKVLNSNKVLKFILFGNNK